MCSKKKWIKAVEWLRHSYLGVEQLENKEDIKYNMVVLSNLSLPRYSSYLLPLLEVKSLCNFLGYSRQAYYQGLKQESKTILEEEIILELVHEIRRELSRYGARKLLHEIRPDLKKLGIQIGRDRFFNLLRRHQLLVEPKKRVYAKTTNSNHPFRKYKNLMLNASFSKDFSNCSNCSKDDTFNISDELTSLYINDVFKVVVCDITYIRTLDGFLYLALITDLFSRKIIGYDISDTLELIGCKRALRMAISSIPAQKAMQLFKYQKTIHHSDRGVQYCSYEYTDVLRKHHIRISMAEAGNCYQNAYAERINGILKGELNLDSQFRNKTLAIQVTKNAIHLYNNKRAHSSLGLQKPSHVFDIYFKELLSKI